MTVPVPPEEAPNPSIPGFPDAESALKAAYQMLKREVKADQYQRGFNDGKEAAKAEILQKLQNVLNRI